MSKDENKIPTAEYTIKMQEGRQVRLKDIHNQMLKKLAHKHLRDLRRGVLKLCIIKKELERRDYEDGLEFLASYRDFNVFQMMTHATLLGVNNYNRDYGGGIPIIPEGEEEEDAQDISLFKEEEEE